MKFQRNVVSQIAKICCALCIFLLASIGAVIYKASLISILLFILFLFVYVLIPGVLIGEQLGANCDYLSICFLRSFFLGFALNITLYYLNVLTGADLLLVAVCPILSIVYIVKRAGQNKSSFLLKLRGSLTDTPVSFYIFTSLVFLCSMLSTQYEYVSPEMGEFSSMNIDFAYHAGIINSLMSTYPPSDPWVDGLSIHYHFFTEMLMSIPCEIFHIAPEKILLSCTPYLITPLFSLSLYSFFLEFSNRKESAGQYCLVFHFANMFILKQFPKSWLLFHIYSNINNAGIGIACMLTVLPLLKSWDSESLSAGIHKHSGELFMLSIFTMLMSGIKGPIAVVFVGGIIGTVLLGLILKKVEKNAVAMAALAAISFALIFIYVLGSEHQNTSGGSLFNPGEITDIFFLKSSIMNALEGLGVPRVISWIVLFAVFSVAFFTAFLLPFIIAYVREFFLVVVGRKDFVLSRIVVYAICLVGYLSMLFLDFSGNSQVYFGFTAAVLIPMVVFWFFEETSILKTQLIRYFFIICFCISALTSALYMFGNINTAKAYAQAPNKNRDPYKNISAAEYEGLLWLKENTAEDSLIASDRHFSVNPEKYQLDRRNNNTHFAYAVYSQRRQYLEGSGFSIDQNDLQLRSEMIAINLRMHDPSYEERGALARSLGVDYIIVSKRFNEDVELGNEDYKLCFSNSDMDIYAVEQSN